MANNLNNPDLVEAVENYRAILEGNRRKREGAFPSTFAAEKGRSYYKIVQCDHSGSRSAVAFVDANGTIWKPKSWAAPIKNFARGSVYKIDVSPNGYAQVYRG